VQHGSRFVMAFILEDV